MPTLHETLTEMGSILSRHGHVAQAETLRQIANIEDSFRFADEAVSMEIWGGAGSVVDSEFQDKRDNRRFNELVVELAHGLDDLGLGTPRTRWVAQTMEDWLIANPQA
jgi:hypothetical protein